MWEAGHAFMNQSNPKSYNAEVASKALTETIQFFKENVGWLGWLTIGRMNGQRKTMERLNEILR